MSTTTGTDRPVTIRTIREHGIAVLTRAGVPSPDVDTDLLLSHVLGLSRGEVLARAAIDAGVDTDELLAFTGVLERRAAREPLQHITGIAPFRSLELAVGPGVFVPRPETESVAQLAIDLLHEAPVVGSGPIAVDLGTGSGAIALSIATEVPQARVYAVENSARAFIWTKQNFRRVDAANAELRFVDLADALPELDGTVDLVVSNPPYIPVGAVPRDPEVRLHDPEHALYGGVDGLDVVRLVSLTGLRLLHAGGTLIMEHGDAQGAEIRALLAADGWVAVATHQDLTRRDRATVAVRPRPADA